MLRIPCESEMICKAEILDCLVTNIMIINECLFIINKVAVSYFKTSNKIHKLWQKKHSLDSISCIVVP